MPKTYQLKIILNDTQPLVWRRILVDSKLLLPDFHKILQTTMGWTNSHLHDFNYNQIVYGRPQDDEFGIVFIDYKKISLDSLLKTVGTVMLYNYDFGDSWEHTIALEAISEQTAAFLHPTCVEGERACPPEDCGGIPGYQNILKIIAKPKHPEFKDTIQGGVPEGYDPTRFDLQKVNDLLKTKDFGCIAMNY